MKSIKRIIFYFFICIGSVIVILSLLSLISNVNLWYFKVLDFPRMQYLIIAVVCLLVIPFLLRQFNWPAVLLITGLCAAIYIQGVKILPYYFGEKVVPDLVQQASANTDTAGILIANVLITNKNSQEFLRMVDTANPDLLLVMEVNKWWIKELEILKEKFPYQVEHPLDNAYGIALYSKFPFQEEKVLFLNHDDVPSIHAKIEFPSGESFIFHGMHPVAPVPSEKYPDNINDKEVALIKVGDMVSAESYPSIVAGDFNDVSWSNTSRLFEQKGDLRNVRLGRGLYNTFNAKSTYLRWPLDHFFVTKEFKLSRIEKLQPFGSDHFPLYVELALNN